METSFVRCSSRTIIVVMLAMLIPVMGSQAAEWKPTKPIEFVAPFAPGGGSDVLARSIASIIEGEKLCPVTVKIAGDALEGTWQGGGYSGTLKGKRRP